MALVIPPGFAQVGIEMRNDGDPDPWYITFGIDTDGVGGDFAGAAANIATSFLDTLGGGLHTSTTISGVTMRIGQDGGDPLTVFYPFGFPGESSADKLPQNCALLVTKVTNLGGRQGKGRFFVPNILTENSVDQVGVISTSVLADIQSFTDIFLERLNGEGDPPGIPTPMVLLHNSTGLSTPDPTPVTALVVSNVIATQRRRLR